jgi:hypothetical protein
MKPIDCREKDKRIELIEFLENNGYIVVNDDVTDREQLIESKFPILINSKEKTITMYHTITASAAAAGSGILISLDDFYKEYKRITMTYEEYYNEVYKLVSNYLPDEDIDEYLSRPDIKEMLLKQFDGYTKNNIAGYSPAATANCLDYMY